MTSLHEQAMNHVYQQVLQRLLGYFSRAERTALQLLIQRLMMVAGGIDRVAEFKVLAIQTGTRESCYALAMLRAAQLTLAYRAPATFQLRVASLRLNGESAGTQENIHQCYSALFLYDDPRVEVLMVDNREILPFNHLSPLSDAGHEANRLNLLMIGHRRNCDGPLDLWDDGFLAAGEFYGQVSRWDHGVDALVCSDTPRHQKHFIAGLKRALVKAGLPARQYAETAQEQLFALLDDIGHDGYRALNPELIQPVWRPVDCFETCRRTTLVDIHDMLVSNLEDRLPLLSEFLNYQQESLAAQVGDNEYVNVAIAAHVRGLQACFVHGLNYESGVTEHFQRTLVMMRRRQMPDQQCEQAAEVFAKLTSSPEQRALVTAQAQKSLGLSEAQLVCMLFAPFADKGAALERFLRHCHPGMLVAMPDLHRALQGKPVPEQVLQWMDDVSGLPLHMVGKLYRMGLAPEAMWPEDVAVTTD